jgi:hypothetical protein
MSQIAREVSVDSHRGQRVIVGASPLEALSKFAKGGNDGLQGHEP